MSLPILGILSLGWITLRWSTGLQIGFPDLEGSLEKTRIIDIKDSEGILIGYEFSYSSEDHYLGQEGFNSDDSLGWGSAKAVLPLAVADGKRSSIKR